MGRVHDAELIIESLRHTSNPRSLYALVRDVVEKRGSDTVSIHTHGDISSAVPSLDHMRNGYLIGISTCPLDWIEQYRDEQLVEADPRVTACRSTASAFSSGDLGRLVPVTSEHRNIFDQQRRANIGESFTVPTHFPS